MTFRPPLLKRWKYPFLLCLCAAGVWLGIFLLLHLHSRRSHSEIYLIGTCAVAFITLIPKSWRIWTTSITVDDGGLRWSRGSTSEALRWDEISELGYSYTRGRRRLLIGPVRSLSKMLHPLPMLPRELYAQIKTRIGGLPPDIERDYYSRQSR